MGFLWLLANLGRAGSMGDCFVPQSPLAPRETVGDMTSKWGEKEHQAQSPWGLDFPSPLPGAFWVCPLLDAILIPFDTMKSLALVGAWA